MAEHKYLLKPIPASDLIQRLAATVSAVSAEKNISHFSAYTNIGTINFLNDQARKGSELKNAIQSGLSVLNDRPYVELRSAQVNTSDGYNLQVDTADDYVIKLTTTDNKRDSVQGLTLIVDQLAANFNLLRKHDLDEARLPVKERDALRVAQSILLDFSTQAAHLSQLSASNTEKMNELIIKKTQELENLYSKRRENLEIEFKERHQGLNKQDETFRAEKSKFDARENTVVRRDLLSKLETLIEKQKKIEITADTHSKRAPIRNFCLGAMGVGLVAMAAFGFKLFSQTEFDWHYLIPFSTGTILFVSTGIFFIRWNDQWFKDHAHAEFHNRKFYSDILRASWIAELLFEWKEKKDVPFPEPLISSYTHNLFSGATSEARTPHPFDDLSAAMKDISKLKLGKGTVEIEKPVAAKPRTA